MKERVENQAHVHLPVKEGLCSNCHAPHASKNKNLLAMTGKELCANCHPDLMKKLTAAYAHSPVVQGECLKCHNPHDSQNESLLVNDSIAVCASCHEVQGKFTHPVGQGTVDPRTKQVVTCVSCHEAHGSEYEFVLLEDRQRNLCIQCHKR
jgi:predicted CXXCH cytochrome family protein